MTRTGRAALICGALAASAAVFLLSTGADASWGGDLFQPQEGRWILPAAAQWIAAVVLGFGLAWTTVVIGAFSLKLVVAALALIETALFSWLLYRAGVVWLPWTALMAGALGTGFGLLYSWSAPGRRRRFLEAVFGGRISRETFERWLDSDEALPFAGAQREATVLIIRVFNRGQWAEALSPEENVAFSHGLNCAVAGIVQKAGGLLVEGEGDHWMAAFGAVLPEPDHAADACRAALALRGQFAVFDWGCRERWGLGLDFGVAVHSGTASVGASGERFFVTGGPVEFAGELCQANRAYGTRILAGPRTAALAAETIEVRPAELIWNGETQTREEVYELMTPKGGLSVDERARREVFWKGVILCRRGQWNDAARLFEIVLRDSPAGDPLAGFYRERALAAAGEEGGTVR